MACHHVQGVVCSECAVGVARFIPGSPPDTDPITVNFLPMVENIRDQTIVDFKTQELVCPTCGIRKKLVLPQSMDDLSKVCIEFSKVHAGCPTSMGSAGVRAMRGVFAWLLAQGGPLGVEPSLMKGALLSLVHPDGPLYGVDSGVLDRIEAAVKAYDSEVKSNA